MIRKIIVAGAISLAAAIPVAQATPLIDFTNDASSFVWYGNDSGCSGGCMLGYTLNVRSAVTVDGLGVYDSSSDGLNNTHEVGLWTSGGTLLASGSVGPGASGEASASGDGSFLYTSIASLTLNVGTYVVAALYETGDTDPVVFQASGIFSNDAGVAYSEARFSNTGVFSMPTGGAGGGTTDRYFGPTLRIAGNTVPEPGTLALLGLGLAGFGWSRRKTA